jgi:hypothetical protein
MKNYLALFACSALSLIGLLSACTSAGKCKRGEIGCACTLDKDSCVLGAQCNANKMCVEESTGSAGKGSSNSGTGGSHGTGGTGSGGTGGKGTGGSSGMTGSDAGGASGKGGTGGNKSDGGSGTGGSGTGGHKSDGGAKQDAGPVVSCPGDSLDSACRAFCKAFCRNQDLLCVASQCSAGDCDPGGALYDVCDMTCGKDSSPTKCVQSLCVGEGQRSCEEFGYSKMSTGVYQSGCFNDDPKCVLNADFGCSDTCGTLPNQTGGDLANNGMCEDGGKNSTTSACPRGTDCTDCKPRTCAKTAMSCTNNGDCCGYYDDKSLCVDTGSGGTCLATCPDMKTCPGTQTCKSAKDSNNKTFYVCAP